MEGLVCFHGTGPLTLTVMPNFPKLLFRIPRPHNLTHSFTLKCIPATVLAAGCLSGKELFSPPCKTIDKKMIWSAYLNSRGNSATYFWQVLTGVKEEKSLS